MNVAVLKQAKKDILAHPSQVNMCAWFTELLPSGRSAGGCGTAGCIAAWIALRTRQKPNLTLRVFRDELLSRQEVKRYAAQAARLTNGEACRLFFPVHWPKKFREQLNKVHAPGLEVLRRKRYVRVIARRIDHFIKTKGKE